MTSLEGFYEDINWIQDVYYINWSNVDDRLMKLYEKIDYILVQNLLTFGNKSPSVKVSSLLH